MSDWMILTSFLAVEAWLLVVTLYVAKNARRSKGDAGVAGPPGPPGPMGPMGAPGLDYDPTVLVELNALLNQDEGRITALEDRLNRLQDLIAPRGPQETYTGNSARIEMIEAPKGVYVQIPKGSLNLPSPPEEKRPEDEWPD